MIQRPCLSSISRSVTRRHAKSEERGTCCPFFLGFSAFQAPTLVLFTSNHPADVRDDSIASFGFFGLLTEAIPGETARQNGLKGGRPKDSKTQQALTTRRRDDEAACVIAGISEPFDHPDWIFELKHDEFRALAHIDSRRCRLVSRRGHVFSSAMRMPISFVRRVTA
jgi:hypothetical protein